MGLGVTPSTRISRRRYRIVSISLSYWAISTGGNGVDAWAQPEFQVFGGRHHAPLMSMSLRPMNLQLPRGVANYHLTFPGLIALIESEVGCECRFVQRGNSAPIYLAHSRYEPLWPSACRRFLASEKANHSNPAPTVKPPAVLPARGDPADSTPMTTRREDD
jgi:hypothetical protein